MPLFLVDPNRALWYYFTIMNTSVAEVDTWTES